MFLSYSRRNTRIAQRIHLDLLAAGLSVWMDMTDARPGTRIREAINHGIEDSDLFLVLLSEHLIDFQWVLNELDAAMLRKITTRKTYLIPLLAGQISIDNIPQDLAGKIYIDLRRDFSRKYQRYKASLFETVMAMLSAAGKGGAVAPGSLSWLLGDEFEAHNESRRIAER